MLGRVSSSVRVDSAWQRLTPSLELECASLCSSLSSLVRRTHEYSSRTALEEKGRTGVRAPTSQSCRGLQEQGSIRSKPRLPGAADPDKYSILYHAFRYGLRYVKPRFISRLPCSPFFVPKDYLLGPNLVVVAAAGKWNEEPKPASSLPPPRA